MEATLQIICDVSDVRYMQVFRVIVVVTSEIEVNLLGEEIFQEEIQ